LIDTSKKNYKKNFEEKKKLFREAFSDFSEIEYFESPPKNFRYRAEFNLLKLEKEYAFGMTLEGKKEPVGSFSNSQYKNSGTNALPFESYYETPSYF
jgi:tRNA/tmRNA/rRNA uracil-C5-methylase (TrmA/RlmC/RlmD family)